MIGCAVGGLIGAVSKSSPQVVAGAAVGVAVATLLVQVFTWLDRNDRDRGSPPSTVT